MQQKNNIASELTELESQLSYPPVPVYVVPQGYFDALADDVLRRIRKIENAPAREETILISDEVGNLPLNLPYHIPSGYFETLSDTMLSLVNSQHLSAKDELAELSPLLSGMKKEMPFEVPAGYFDKVTPQRQEAKVVSISGRKWFRVAAAAMIAGIIAIAALVFNNPNSERAIARFEKKVTKEIRTTSDSELKDFIDNTSTSQDVALNTPKEEIRELLKDVPATELQAFLDDIADPEIEETTSMD